MMSTSIEALYIYDQYKYGVLVHVPVTPNVEAVTPSSSTYIDRDQRVLESSCPTTSPTQPHDPP